jgi:hypothetical protein
MSNGIRQLAAEEYIWPKIEKETKEWRQLNDEELHDLYCSPSVVRVIKTRRKRWTGNVAYIEGRSGAYRGNLREKRPFGRPWGRWGG